MLKCSRLAGVEPLVTVGVILFLILMNAISYCHLPIFSTWCRQCLYLLGLLILWGMFGQGRVDLGSRVGLVGYSAQCVGLVIEQPASKTLTF